MNKNSKLNVILTKQERKKRITVLKAKKLNLTKIEKKELEVLNFAHTYKMEFPFGALLEKSFIIQTLFENQEDFTENLKSNKWDFMGINMGLDPFSSSEIIEKVKPHISFYKGVLGALTLVNNADVFQTGGQGDGVVKTTPPPTPTP